MIHPNEKRVVGAFYVNQHNLADLEPEEGEVIGEATQEGGAQFTLAEINDPYQRVNIDWTERPPIALHEILDLSHS